MAGMTGAFADALNRKYANLESNTQGENRLRDAQATDITAQTGANIGLKNAQANLQNANAATTKPLADASIAATQSQIGLQRQQGQLYGAQSGLYGAQTHQINEGFNVASDDAFGNYAAERGARPDAPGTGGYASRSPAPAGYGGYDGIPSSDTGITPVNHYSTGTSNVPPTGAHMAAPLPPPGVAPVQPMGQPMVTPLLDHMHGIVHHAMSALHASMSEPNVAHYAGGGSVPGPGQTQGGGSWEGPQPTTGTPMGTPTSSTPNQDLRAKMFPVKAAGGMGNVPSPGQTQGSGSWEGPQPTTSTPSPAMGAPSPTPNADLRAKMGYGVKAADGLSKVPGKGNPGVDKVPAVLAPGEAVLNQGAANHMGRGAIAALNALGAHAMAAQGTPPMQSPPGGGAPQPMGGPPPKMAKPAGPPQGKTVAPMARGMPPAKSKAPPAKGKAPPPKMAAKK